MPVLSVFLLIIHSFCSFWGDRTLGPHANRRISFRPCRRHTGAQGAQRPACLPAVDAGRTLNAVYLCMQETPHSSEQCGGHHPHLCSNEKHGCLDRCNL